MLRDSLIHVSKSTIRGSSYNTSWNVPPVDGDYSWCPNDKDPHPYLEVELGKICIDIRCILFIGSFNVTCTKTREREREMCVY